LLISTFIASYNEPEEDEKLFRPKRQKKRNNKKIKNQILIIKTCHLSRILNIYFLILQIFNSDFFEMYEETNKINQLEIIIEFYELVNINFISVIGKFFTENIRYTINIPFSNMQQISKIFNIELKEYVNI
jgi:hypothetical protein